jgi:hypothetical protein
MKKNLWLSALALCLGFASCDKSEEDPLLIGDSEITTQEGVDASSTRGVGGFNSYGIDVLGLSKIEDELYWEGRRSFEYELKQIMRSFAGTTRLGREAERELSNALDQYRSVSVRFYNKLDSNSMPTTDIFVKVTCSDGEVSPTKDLCIVADCRVIDSNGNDIGCVGNWPEGYRELICTNLMNGDLVGITEPEKWTNNPSYEYYKVWWHSFD